MYKFKNLSASKKIVNGVTDRGFGNMSWDFPGAVGNRLKVKEDNDFELIVGMEQTHSDEIHIVTEETLKNSDVDDIEVPNVDALITNVPGACLVVKVADCQPVLMYAPDIEYIACVHSGWKGSLVNIIGKTVQRLKDLGAYPAKLIVGIGPSLGPCCAEFSDPASELPEEFHKYILQDNKVDFLECTKDQLDAEGVNLENVEFAGVCTKCANDKYYSYRIDKDEPGSKRSGRMAGFIGLKA